MAWVPAASVTVIGVSMTSSPSRRIRPSVGIVISNADPDLVVESGACDTSADQLCGDSHHTNSGSASREQCGQALNWAFPVERLAWAAVELGGHGGKVLGIGGRHDQPREL